MSTQKNRAMIIVPIMLALVALVGFSRTAAFSTMRGVDMVTLFAAGMLCGVALTAVVRLIKQQ